MTDTRDISTFYLDGVLFGIDVLHVQEILEAQEMTPVPLAAQVVRGLINLRGEIVMAVDLRDSLNLPLRDASDESMNVIVSDGEDLASFLVDETSDVLTVDTTQFELPPPTLSNEAVELIEGVYKLRDTLLIVLDTKKIIARTTELCEANFAAMRESV